MDILTKGRTYVFVRSVGRMINNLLLTGKIPLLLSGTLWLTAPQIDWLAVSRIGDRTVSLHLHSMIVGYKL
jgi:hypothetical protein